MQKTVNDAWILRDKAIKSWAAENLVISSIVVPAQKTAKIETFVGKKHSLGLFYYYGLLEIFNWSKET